ncbi:MAG: type I polyketide synthase, partial [Rubrivivax sp.]
MSYADQYDPDAGVAIVGMAGRFPGANDIRSLWRMLQAGRSGIRHFEAAELESSFAEDMQARAQPGYVAARGVLDDVACFDEGFFGFSPAEAALLDPQQRLFLQACWEALEDAACDPARFDGLMGVFAGATANSYYLNNLMSRRDVTDRLGLLTTQMANQEHYLATRVAYKLDLRGPALSIHTACSTSLVAVATAVQSLQAFQCDMALAGGVSVTLPQRRGYRYQEGSILSPDGECRPFDAQACGTVFSNGLGVVVLRRLDDALAAGDRIYAVIKGAALNNDGRGKLSFTAPSVTGQAECVAMAQAMAGIDPQTIQYVEAHGTGTALGDPIEVRALTQAFRAGGAKGQGFCALGSLKASLGHLDAAAGVAGLIRAALALHHRELPGQPNFRQAHPELELDSSPFVVHSTARPWPRGQHPRRAAVSSLGVGGTNAHLVLEEPPVVAIAQGEQPEEQPGLVVVSARDPDALRRACERLSEAFAHLPDAQFQGAVQTLQRGRQAFAHRVSVVASSAADAARQLAAVAAPASPRLQRAAGTRSGLKVAFLMAGQGAQRVLAWHGLYEREPVFRNELDSCLRTLKPLLGRDLTELLFPQHRHAEALQGAQQLLDQTQWAQPAIVSLQLSLARLYAHWGVEPAALLGHSVGEWTAACLAGSFSRDDTLAVVAERGRLMQQQPPGVMLAVRGTVAELQPYLSQQVVLAACNGPRLNVLAGPPPAMKAVADALRAQGLVFKALATSHAFHSPMMDSLLPAFEAKVAEFRRSAPRIPWVSGLTGQFVTAQEAQSPAYWARQLREPGQFSQGLATLLAADHALLDIGPGDGMSRLARQQPDAGRSPVIVAAGSAPLTADAEVAAQDAALDAAAQHRAVIAAAGELWQVGAGLNVDALSPPPWRRVDLPTYPFARNTHWVEPALPVPPPTAVDAQSVHRSDGGTSRDKRISVTAPLVPVPSLDSNNMDVAVHFLPRLRELVAELSGVDAAGLDPQSSFLELGLDSLALTQLSQSLHREWGVRVPLRRLLEDVSTVQALATELAPQVPTPVLSQPSAVVAPMPAPAAVVASPVPLATFSAVAASMPAAAVLDASPDATLFAQQLAVMQQQLQMLQAGAQGAGAASAPVVAAAAVGVPQILQPTQPVDASLAAPAPPSAGFGPYRPPSTQRSPAAGLGPGSAASLQAFVARDTAHTAQSKRMTQASRAVLADPRSVSG